MTAPPTKTGTTGIERESAISSSSRTKVRIGSALTNRFLEQVRSVLMINDAWAIEVSLPFGKDVLAASLLGQLFEDYFVKLPRAVKM